MTLQKPSGCFTMSTFGPLQKFSRTFVASGALSRTSTRPLLSTRGYCASHTLVEAGRKSVLPVPNRVLAGTRAAPAPLQVASSVLLGMDGEPSSAPSRVRAWSLASRAQCKRSSWVRHIRGPP